MKHYRASINEMPDPDAFFCFLRLVNMYQTIDYVFPRISLPA